MDRRGTWCGFGRGKPTTKYPVALGGDAEIQRRQAGKHRKTGGEKRNQKSKNFQQSKISISDNIVT